MEDAHNLINIGPTNPIQILNQHSFFEDFICVLWMIILTKKNKRNVDVGTGAQQQRQEVY